MSDPSLSLVCLPARLPHNVQAWVFVPGDWLSRSDGLYGITIADCQQIGMNCQETAGRITKDAVF